jgi:hypothetical protein
MTNSIEVTNEPEQNKGKYFRPTLKFSKFHPESVQKRNIVFEIAYLLAWNFQNKIQNKFKPNDRQIFLKKC